jgi:hypothetical protein
MRNTVVENKKQKKRLEQFFYCCPSIPPTPREKNKHTHKHMHTIKNPDVRTTTSSDVIKISVKISLVSFVSKSKDDNCGSSQRP